MRAIGTVAARAVGIVMVAGSTVFCASDFEEITATDAPGRVTDLTVVGLYTDTIALRWTQVDDGTGAPASYAIDYGSPTITEEEVMADGAVVAGTEIGRPASHVLTGLTPAADYQVQVVSFRGATVENAVAGPGSNVIDTATLALLAPGTATATAGDGLVELSATEATGGAPPYGYQWHRSTASGFEPDSGNAVPGLMTMSAADTGLTNGVRYYYRLVVEDRAGTSASYPEVSATPVGPMETPDECDAPSSEWIWCDDFEQDRLSSYFEYENAGGAFSRTVGAGIGSSTGMRVHFDSGQVSAGSLKLAFGSTPDSYMAPVDGGTADYREIFWRVYVRNAPDWTGGGGEKFSRAMILAGADWSQAMIAHLWSGGPNEYHLLADPASGTDEQGNLQTTGYNDFANLRWLGAAASETPIFDGAHVGPWYCVEARVRLNDPGQSNGVFELWFDGRLEVQITGLNWIGSYDSYGINAVFLENYWNGGAPRAQERYFDNFVVSTAPIGCGDV